MLSHVNSTRDFYIHTTAEPYLQTVFDIQQKIQDKVAKNELGYLERLEPNMLCVSFYETDARYYRAKINIFSNDLVEVFFIDYGNSSIVNGKQLREITPDLINNLPESLAINCELRLDEKLHKADYEEFNSWFVRLVENPDSKFQVKALQRKFGTRYNDRDNYIYEVEMFDHLGENVQDIFLASRHSDLADDLPMETKKEKKDDFALIIVFFIIIFIFFMFFIFLVFYYFF